MNILTFDIEEWFHLLSHQSTRTVNEWRNFEIRIHQNMERIFSLLDKSEQKATFFCVGWIASQYPEVINDIVKRGHEIGSHTHMHQLVYEQSPLEFHNDVEYSIKTLEDITGKKVTIFRAPGFSIKEENIWAFEILHELGIEVDCSVFPASRSHGGFPSYGQQGPSLISYNGITMKEMPINHVDYLGKSIIFSGGGYFRLFPYYLIEKWTRKSNYTMAYLHPRDFDPGQPVIQDLSKFRKFKCYVGLSRSSNKLERWIEDFKFIDVQTAVGLIDWSQVPIVALDQPEFIKVSV